ncbi:hypothetical protein [Bradyrhizobium pachyrhizi]|uniref:hypothetical protein n=1 Tax=Bradyrhizobium pachyrhizi TaxID=280333 RepID=UPI00067BFF94|nr:hypothetical protein [Bradyrhizobium pachyrhizi]
MSLDENPNRTRSEVIESTLADLTINPENMALGFALETDPVKHRQFGTQTKMPLIRVAYATRQP